MRKIFFIPTLIVLTLSCAKKHNTEIITLSAEDKELVAKYSVMGRLHNEGLDATFNGLKTLLADKKNRLLFQSSNGGISLRKVNELVFGDIKAKFKMQGMNERDYYVADTLIPTKDTYKLGFRKHLLSVVKSKVSEELLLALDELDQFFLGSEVKISESDKQVLFGNHLARIKNQNEKVALIAAVSVVEASSDYWSENYHKWEILRDELGEIVASGMVQYGTNGSGNGSGKGKGAGEAAKDIVYADAAGAVTGCIGGATTGALGGSVVIPGVGTVTGAAAGGLVGLVGGAVGGSAAEAIHEFIKWAIDW